MDEINIQTQKRGKGAPEGNSNARKHGFYSKHGREHFKIADALIWDCHRMLEALLEKKPVDEFLKESKLRSLKYLDNTS